MPVSKNFELAQLASGLDLNQSTGEVVTINLSVGTLSDVDITTVAPTNGQALIWNSTNNEFEPGDSFSQTDFDTAFAAKIATDVTFGGNLIFEGATADAFETTLTVVDPTADRTITLQNASGTLAFLSDVTGGASPGNFTTITLDNNITFEGDTDDANETTLAVVDPTADRTISLPDATGTVMLNVVEDTTPQLGGTLDANGNNIDLDGNELILDADGDTKIYANVDDELNLYTQGVGKIYFNYGSNGLGVYEFGSSGAVFSTTPGSIWPDLYLKRNYTSNTPAAGDKLAQIHARGEDSNGLAKTYGQILFKAESVTQTSDRGSMTLSLHRNNQLVDFYKADATSGVEQNIFYKDIKADTGVNLVFEGATDNTNETTLTVVDPTQDNTITLPDATGTVVIQDSSNDVTIQADTTNSGVDPTLVLYKNDTGNGSDGDGVAAINFKGTNDSGGNHSFGWIQAKIETATAGSEEGKLQLRVAGSNASFQNEAYSGGNGIVIYNDRLEVKGSIDFDTLTSNPSYREGLLWYSNVNHTLNYYADDSNVVHELGLEEHQRVYNNTGATILKGQPLYFSGNYVTGNIDVPTVGLADATDVNKYNAQGIAASDIATGSYGYCLIAGQLHDVNTSGLNAGANFFVGLTPGAVQNASPVYPNYPMCLGWVVKSDATTGILLVNQQNHSVNSFRVRTSAHIGSDLQVDGDLTVLGSTTSVSTSDVTAGAPFYRANEGDAIGEAGTTFSGTGLDDAFFSGHFTGTQSTTYYVKIDSVGTPDTFAVSIDNFASTISSNVAITGNKQLIHSADNIYVEFGATTGHTLNDQWTGVASPVNVDTGFFSNRNTGTSGVGYTHVGIFFDVSDQKWKLVDEYDPTPAGTINTGHASYSEATLVAGTFEGNLDYSYIQNKPDPQITANLTGTVTGTGNVTLTDLQNGTLNIPTTIPGTTNLTLADLVVTNLTVNGTQTINNQTNLTSDDPLFVLNQSQNGEPDIGMIGGYTEASTAQYTGFYRDASDNKWKLFDGYTPNVTSTGSINVNDASFALTTLVAATFEGNLDFSYIQNKPDPVVTVTLTGEVTGTGNATLTDLTSGTISLATTIDPNADVEVNDLTVTGDLNVQGTTTTVNQTTLTVTDSKIFLADGNNADAIDIGTIFEYNDGANDQSAGLFRDANDSGKFKFFKTYTPNVTTTIDTGHASFALGTVVADTFEGNFTGTLTGSISGSATSAATLTTPRNLWGQSFDGSANVSGNLTSVGNITGTSAIEIIASGTNQNIVTTPSGTGYTILGGNVGIGNSVPTEKLEVTGNILANGDVTAKTSNGAILKLQTSDTTVVDGDVVGAIEFSAPDESSGTQAIATAASIVAEADSTFNSSNNDTALVFKTALSTGGNIERARLKHDGLEVSGDFQPNIKIINTDTNILVNEHIGHIAWRTPNEASGGDATGLAATITAKANAEFTSTVNDTRLEFGLGLSGTPFSNTKMTLTNSNLEVAGDMIAKTSDGAILKLQTSDTSVEDGNVLGAIEFSAPDESSGGVSDEISASIVAEADATFSSAANNTDLVFSVGSSGAATEKMRLEHEGTLILAGGSSQGTTKLLVNGTDALMRLGSLGADSGPHGIQFGYASTSSDGMSIMYRTASDAITFEDSSGTSGNRVMSVVQTGNVLIGTTTDDGSSKLQVNGNILTSGSFIFEGATDDTAETTLTVVDPTQDRTISLPDADGTVMVRDSGGVVYGGSANGEMELQGTNPRLRLTDSSANASTFQIFASATGSNDTYNITVDHPNTTAGSSLQIQVDTEKVASFDTTGILLNTGNILRFEGSTDDNAETTLTVTDPTQDRTITLPDATGTVVLDGTLNASIDTHLNQSNPTSGYVLSWNGSDYAWVEQSGGDVVDDTSPQLGGNLDAQTFDITNTGNIELGTAKTISFEGATADAFETTLTVVDPTADRTITLPDKSGDAVVADTTTNNVTLTSTDNTNGPIINIVHDKASPAGIEEVGAIKVFANEAQGGTQQDSSKITFGTDTSQVGQHAGIIRFSTGKFNASGLTELMAMSDLQGVVIKKTITLDTSANIKFEGATSNQFETTLTVVDPTQANTVSLPNASGTVALTNNIASSTYAFTQIFN